MNDVAIGYLARPYVPEVQVVARRRGPWDVNFDLPNGTVDNPNGGSIHGIAYGTSMRAMTFGAKISF